MRTQATMAAAAALLLCGIASAAAITVQSRPADALSLDGAQQQTAWQDLNMPSLDQFGPPGFIVCEGAQLPDSVMAAAMPTKAAHDLPVLRPYDYAMVQHRVVIVNPSDRKIAAVITG
jgi:hypothetical protein